MKSKLVLEDKKKKPVVSNKGSMLLKCELTSDELLACGARLPLGEEQNGGVE